MKYLLDTHTLIWFISGDEQLSFYAKELTGNKETQRHEDTKKEIKSKLCLEI
ncbi:MULTISPECIES: type II toxin-antitoxin system VapC family toxin [Planktothrix]|uniref:type II toxin-antitoxin system VapC family toxin n=1 Tax=Planktothrix TaxID=54304 RepID=UPI0004134A93|nr:MULTISPECIES: type II toxin-antitoxin system VapC family toxin [Planktothrix]